MIINKTGLIANNLYVNGFTWSPVYLLAGRIPLLFEAGFSCVARLYEKDIRKILSQKDPAFLFLTHVHYDHCGSAAYFRTIFPDLKICASQRASDIMQRENAIRLMSSLSQYAIPLIAKLPGIESSALLTEPFRSFHIDKAFSKEEVINVDDGLSVSIMMTPGHTRDMLSYYIPERKILIATESAGCLGRNGHIVSEFLIDYDGYIRTLKRFGTLDIEILCQGHHFVFTGKDVQRFLAGSLQTAESFKEHVVELLLHEEGSIDRVVDIIRKEEYDPNHEVKQPEKAYLINLRTQIIHLAKRLGEEPE